jgi:hypothetical protein
MFLFLRLVVEVMEREDFFLFCALNIFYTVTQKNHFQGFFRFRSFHFVHLTLCGYDS